MSMLASHAVALLALTLLLLAWLGVQRAWRGAFPEACAEDDPLSGRLGCSGAACPKRRQDGSPCPKEENP